MSRSAGPGSPVFFHCHAYRRENYRWRNADDHVVTLTGRVRPYGTQRKRSARGLRSDVVSREYVCSCGHRGWSNHKDLMPRQAKEQT